MFSHPPPPIPPPSLPGQPFLGSFPPHQGPSTAIIYNGSFPVDTVNNNNVMSCNNILFVDKEHSVALQKEIYFKSPVRIEGIHVVPDKIPVPISAQPGSAPEMIMGRTKPSMIVRPFQLQLFGNNIPSLNSDQAPCNIQQIVTTTFVEPLHVLLNIQINGGVQWLPIPSPMNVLEINHLVISGDYEEITLLLHGQQDPIRVIAPVVEPVLKEIVVPEHALNSMDRYVIIDDSQEVTETKAFHTVDTTFRQIDAAINSTINSIQEKIVLGEFFNNGDGKNSKNTTTAMSSKYNGESLISVHNAGQLVELLFSYSEEQFLTYTDEERSQYLSQLSEVLASCWQIDLRLSSQECNKCSDSIGEEEVSILVNIVKTNLSAWLAMFTANSDIDNSSTILEFGSTLLDCIQQLLVNEYTAEEFCLSGALQQLLTVLYIKPLLPNPLLLKVLQTVMEACAHGKIIKLLIDSPTVPDTKTFYQVLLEILLTNETSTDIALCLSTLIALCNVVSYLQGMQRQVLETMACGKDLCESIVSKYADCENVASSLYASDEMDMEVSSSYQTSDATASKEQWKRSIDTFNQYILTLQDQTNQFTSSLQHLLSSFANESNNFKQFIIKDWSYSIINTLHENKLLNVLYGVLSLYNLIDDVDTSIETTQYGSYRVNSMKSTVIEIITGIFYEVTKVDQFELLLNSNDHLIRKLWELSHPLENTLNNSFHFSSKYEIQVANLLPTFSIYDINLPVKKFFELITVENKVPLVAWSMYLVSFTNSYLQAFFSGLQGILSKGNITVSPDDVNCKTVDDCYIVLNQLLHFSGTESIVKKLVANSINTVITIINDITPIVDTNDAVLTNTIKVFYTFLAATFQNYPQPTHWLVSSTTELIVELLNAQVGIPVVKEIISPLFLSFNTSTSAASETEGKELTYYLDMKLILNKAEFAGYCHRLLALRRESTSRKTLSMNAINVVSYIHQTCTMTYFAVQNTLFYADGDIRQNVDDNVMMMDESTKDDILRIVRSQQTFDRLFSILKRVMIIHNLGLELAVSILNNKSREVSDQARYFIFSSFFDTFVILNNHVFTTMGGRVNSLRRTLLAMISMLLKNYQNVDAEGFTLDVKKYLNKPFCNEAMTCLLDVITRTDRSGLVPVIYSPSAHNMLIMDASGKINEFALQQMMSADWRQQHLRTLSGLLQATQDTSAHSKLVAMTIDKLLTTKQAINQSEYLAYQLVREGVVSMIMDTLLSNNSTTNSNTNNPGDAMITLLLLQTLNEITIKLQDISSSSCRDREIFSKIVHSEDKMSCTSSDLTVFFNYFSILAAQLNQQLLKILPSVLNRYQDNNVILQQGVILLQYMPKEFNYFSFVQNLTLIGGGFTVEFLAIKGWLSLEESFQTLYEITEARKQLLSLLAPSDDNTITEADELLRASNSEKLLSQQEDLLLEAHAQLMTAVIALKSVLDVAMYCYEHGKLSLTTLNKCMRTMIADSKKVIIRYQRVYTMWASSLRLELSVTNGSDVLSEENANSAFQVNYEASNNENVYMKQLAYDARHGIISNTLKVLVEICSKFSRYQQAKEEKINVAINIHSKYNTENILQVDWKSPLDQLFTLRAELEAVEQQFQGILQSSDVSLFVDELRQDMVQVELLKRCHEQYQTFIVNNQRCIKLRYNAHRSQEQADSEKESKRQRFIQDVRDREESEKAAARLIDSMQEKFTDHRSPRQSWSNDNQYSGRGGGPQRRFHDREKHHVPGNNHNFPRFNNQFSSPHDNNGGNHAPIAPPMPIDSNAEPQHTFLTVPKDPNSRLRGMPKQKHQHQRFTNNPVPYQNKANPFNTAGPPPPFPPQHGGFPPQQYPPFPNNSAPPPPFPNGTNNPGQGRRWN